jgi:hypothetical protein
MVSCVYVAALQRADHSYKEFYRQCKNDYGTEEEAKAQQRTAKPLMNKWMNCEYVNEPSGFRASENNLKSKFHWSFNILHGVITH